VVVVVVAGNAFIVDSNSSLAQTGMGPSIFKPVAWTARTS
jgi:hypothetical protein